MGLVIDTSLFVEAERLSRHVSVFEPGGVLTQTGETDFAVCAITLTELVFGYAYAAPRLPANERTVLLDQIRRQVRIYSVDEGIAIRAGELNVSLRRNGTPIGLADVLIAATALELGFGVLTHNIRHFNYVPELRVVDAAAL